MHICTEFQVVKNQLVNNGKLEMLKTTRYWSSTENLKFFIFLKLDSNNNNNNNKYSLGRSFLIFDAWYAKVLIPNLVLDKGVWRWFSAALRCYENESSLPFEF